MSRYKNHYFDRYAMDQFDGRRQNIFSHVLGQLSIKKIGKLLDVGTGCGFFLVEARKRGWQVKGIDLSRESVQFGRCRHHLDIHEGTLHDYDDDDRFDAVTYLNVLEHISEPWENIKKAALLLKNDGVLYVRFPNARYHALLYKLLAGWKSAEFAARFTIFHEFSFSQRFMKRMLVENGFKHVRIYNSPVSDISKDADRKYGLLSKVGTKALFLLTAVMRNCGVHNLPIGPSLEAIAVK
ncbi:MAG: class I SAM-dependent methyltransferase [Desulfobacterales bacterium]|nr:class I SAM-dependent methyltransferase [Desulfobacterales bacterium]